jgi:hypothetical protein
MLALYFKLWGRLDVTGGWVSGACEGAGPGAPTLDARADDDGSRGYAALEALMAMLLLSLSLSFGLAAYGQARRAADAALEIDRARGLIDDLLAGDADRLGAESGVSGRFSWTRDLQKTASGGLVEICRRSVSVVNARTGRRYAMARLQACPVEVAP